MFLYILIELEMKSTFVIYEFHFHALYKQFRFL